jgi:hypothetical protein
MNVRLSSLGRVKALWKVSIKELIDRAYGLKLMTPSQHRTIKAEYNKAFKGGEPFNIDIEQPMRLRQIVDYHRTRLGYSIDDLARLLAANPEHVERAYLERPTIRLVVSN